ncbi:MAG: histidinol-phosphatase [Candidatus Hydrogenedentota bacterium]
MSIPRDNAKPPAPDWRASFHGGHSGLYCDHAEGAPEAFLEAARAQGLHTFGFTEHAPRTEARFLYAEERALGWDVDHLLRLFADYAVHIARLAERWAGEMTVLKGFESEVAPAADYPAITQRLREEHGFDYIVGSVHHVDEVIIDYTADLFAEAVRRCGGLEATAIRYYATLAEMVRALRPEIVGHFDLIRRNAPDEAAVATPAVRAAALGALDAVAEAGSALDVNTSGYRKGFGRPYPAPWVVDEAAARGIGFILGDDSHRPGEVGSHLDDARDYLREQGVDTVVLLVMEQGALTRRTASLAPPEPDGE